MEARLKTEGDEAGREGGVMVQSFTATPIMINITIASISPTYEQNVALRLSGVCTKTTRFQEQTRAPTDSIIKIPICDR